MEHHVPFKKQYIIKMKQVPNKKILNEEEIIHQKI